MNAFRYSDVEPAAVYKVMAERRDIRHFLPTPIAVLCLGRVNSFYKEPMLVETGWTTEKPLSEMLMENGWAG